MVNVKADEKYIDPETENLVRKRKTDCIFSWSYYGLGEKIGGFGWTVRKKENFVNSVRLSIWLFGSLLFLWRGAGFFKLQIFNFCCRASFLILRVPGLQYSDCSTMLNLLDHLLILNSTRRDKWYLNSIILIDPFFLLLQFYRSISHHLGRFWLCCWSLVLFQENLRP